MLSVAIVYALFFKSASGVTVNKTCKDLKTAYNQRCDCNTTSDVTCVVDQLTYNRACSCNDTNKSVKVMGAPLFKIFPDASQAILYNGMSQNGRSLQSRQQDNINNGCPSVDFPDHNTVATALGCCCIEECSQSQASTDSPVRMKCKTDNCGFGFGFTVPLLNWRIGDRWDYCMSYDLYVKNVYELDPTAMTEINPVVKEEYWSALWKSKDPYRHATKEAWGTEFFVEKPQWFDTVGNAEVAGCYCKDSGQCDAAQARCDTHWCGTYDSFSAIFSYSDRCKEADSWIADSNCPLFCKQGWPWETQGKPACCDETRNSPYNNCEWQQCECDTLCRGCCDQNEEFQTNECDLQCTKNNGFCHNSPHYDNNTMISGTVNNVTTQYPKCSDPTKDGFPPIQCPNSTYITDCENQCISYYETNDWLTNANFTTRKDCCPPSEFSQPIDGRILYYDYEWNREKISKLPTDAIAGKACFVFCFEDGYECIDSECVRTSKFLGEPCDNSKECNGPLTLNHAYMICSYWSKKCMLKEEATNELMDKPQVLCNFWDSECGGNNCAWVGGVCQNDRYVRAACDQGQGNNCRYNSKCTFM